MKLLIISGFVVVSGLFGMLTVLLTGLNERRRELAILRSVGARPVQILSLPPYQPSDVLFNVDVEAYRDLLADYEADVAAEDIAESIGEKMNKE